MKTYLIDEELRDKLALVTENGIFDYCQRLRDLPEAPPLDLDKREGEGQTVSRTHDYTDPKELIGQTPPHIAMRTAPQPQTVDWLHNIIEDESVPLNHAVIDGKLVCFNAPQPATGEKK